MDLRQLEIIRAIADTGSFTAAGEKLHVSQSAISRQILLLEEELGEVGLPPHRPAHPDHAGWRSAAATEPPRLPGPAGHRHRHQREAGVAARHASAGRRHDGLPLRLPDPALRSAARASESRPEGDGRQHGAIDRDASFGRRRPRAADAADRRDRPRLGAGARRGAARHHLSRIIRWP